jgi:hypothetical protein
MYSPVRYGEIPLLWLAVCVSCGVEVTLPDLTKIIRLADPLLLNPGPK